jgi:hypothetical protein
MKSKQGKRRRHAIYSYPFVVGSSLLLTLGGFLSDGLDFTGFVHILEKRFSIRQL